MKKCHSIMTISIHAPTRGATQTLLAGKTYLAISIHAPTRGATQRTLDFLEKYAISIHAPTRGATFVPSKIWDEVFTFQSTLLQEERLPHDIFSI